MASTTPAAITVAGLRKAYGSKQVLDGVDLTVPAGTVFALLGPNGAGKTTIVHILSTLIRADGGEAAVGGFDVVSQADEVRGKIGLTGQNSLKSSTSWKRPRSPWPRTPAACRGGWTSP
jgi:ABC-2 type transport system ATP-binding protein